MDNNRWAAIDVYTAGNNYPLPRNCSVDDRMKAYEFSDRRMTIFINLNCVVCKSDTIKDDYYGKKYEYFWFDLVNGDRYYAHPSQSSKI